MTQSDPGRRRSIPTHSEVRGVRVVLRARALAQGASARLIVGICFLIGLGTFLLSLPGMTTRPLSFMDLLFTAASAVTVTGLGVATTSTDFTRLGQIVILLLIQTGGLGFIILVVGALRLFGRRVSMLDRLALVNELGLNSARTMWDVLKVTIGVMLIIETIGALLLYAYWRASGIVPADEVAFYAIFHAVTAFCNAGFDLFFGLERYPQGLPSDIPSLLILGSLVVAGGLGFAVYLDLIFKRPARRLSLHSQVTLITSFFLLLGGAIGLIAGEYRFTEGVLANMSVLERVVLALFQSASARTAGFPGLESFELLHQSSRLLLTGLMFIGSGPGSMGGGITTGTFAVMVIALFSYVRGYRQVRLFRKTISDDTIRRALAVVLVSLALVGVATWLLLLSHDFPLDMALFEVVSAYSTTGLTLGITDDLNTFGRLIIIVMMTCGRLGAMTLMIALLARPSRDHLLGYPEETVLVG